MCDENNYIFGSDSVNTMRRLQTHVRAAPPPPFTKRLATTKSLAAAEQDQTCWQRTL